MLKRLTDWAGGLFNDKKFATIVTNLVLIIYTIVITTFVFSDLFL